MNVSSSLKKLGRFKGFCILMLLILNYYLCYAMCVHNQMWTLYFLQLLVITFWRQVRRHNFFTGIWNFSKSRRARFAGNGSHSTVILWYYSLDDFNVFFWFPGTFQNLFLFIYGFTFAPGSIRDAFCDCSPGTYSLSSLFICQVSPL